jgi:signal transduction histidine kinase
VQLKQALLSVLLNAIQACPIEGSVSLATEANNEHIIVRVIDNGEGISPLHCTRIFEPFFSTKEGASGLGLPLALAIVKMHQGEISFTSEAEKGSTFSISLPGKRKY